MGGTACKIIIDGQFAYAVAEKINADTTLLEAAISASCEVVQYFGHEYEFPEEMANEIISIHKQIITELPITEQKSLQSIVNSLTLALYHVVARLYSDDFPESTIDLDLLMHQLKI